MIQWFCDNIAKFRPVGDQGNNFRGSRKSMPPFASKTTFGGSGFGGHIGSIAHETAMKLCTPIQLAKIATLQNMQPAENESTASPKSSIKSPHKPVLSI